MTRALLCLLLPFLYFSAFAQRECRQNDYERLQYGNHQIKYIPDSGHAVLHGPFFLKDTVVYVYKFTKNPFFSFTHADTAVNRPIVPVPEKITIPVVVHILWNSSRQNISDAQVVSQINALNNDFGCKSADRNRIPSYFSTLAADCGISFVLAKTDPQGHPTSGIVRKQTGVGVFGFDDKAKSNATGGDDAWDANNYLNIWVCNLESGISGYASAPGSAKQNDGVVISTGVFGTINISGPFNRGRTAVHEIGHWLNLRHIWGDANCGDDQVDDTPVQQAATRGCASGERFTCGSTAHGDMYMNFMDFTDDACMYMFTLGQKARMRALFEADGARNSLLFSTALNGEGIALKDTITVNTGVELLLYPNPAVNTITLQLSGNAGVAGNRIYVCNATGQIVKTAVCVSKLLQLDIHSLPAGLYFVKVEGQANGMKKFVKQ